MKLWMKSAEVFSKNFTSKCGYVLKVGIGISGLFCFNFITENISKFRIKEVKVLDKSLCFMKIIVHQNFSCLQVLIYKLTMYTSLLVFNITGTVPILAHSIYKYGSSDNHKVRGNEIVTELYSPHSTESNYSHEPTPSWTTISFSHPTITL